MSKTGPNKTLESDNILRHYFEFALLILRQKNANPTHSLALG